MVKVIDIIGTLDEILQPRGVKDLGPNGLQVPSERATTDHVVTGVSASRALIERAVELEAGLILVHHGLFWDFHPTGLSPVVAERLRLLFRHDIALAAYHLPLDAHPSVGNNALLAEALGAAHDTFGDVGRRATFPGDGIPLADLLARVEQTTGRTPLRLGPHPPAGPDPVRTMAIVSGAAASMLPQAIEEGLDAFLTGEPREHVMADAEEAGIHFIAAGHYATETAGVRRLGEIVAETFGIRHTFVDLPNPV